LNTAAAWPHFFGAECIGRIETLAKTPSFRAINGHQAEPNTAGE